MPVEISLGLLRRAMNDAGPGRRILVDGFPRNNDNVRGWNEVVGEGGANIERVLYFDCPEDSLVQRILSRGETSGRTDDNLKSLKKRFATFKSETLPVVEYYGAGAGGGSGLREAGIVTRIAADGTIEDVWRAARGAVAPLVESEVGERSTAAATAAHAGDWDQYAALCFPRSDGSDGGALAQHRASLTAAGGKVSSEVSSVTVPVPVQVQALGTTAVASGTIVVTAAAGGGVQTFDETRVWHLGADGWELAHYHVSLAPSSP